MQKRRLLVLWTKLQSFVLACLSEYVDSFGSEVELVAYTPSGEAPLTQTLRTGIHQHTRHEIEEHELKRLAFDPPVDAIVVAGWVDRTYCKLAREAKRAGIPTICTLDNPWLGTPRQKLASLTSSLHVRRNFGYIWVPGFSQYEFARRLGFPRSNILTGLHPADLQLFSTGYERHREAKTEKYPHQLLYAGRLLDWKGIAELITAFERAIAITPSSDWKLRIVGNGPMAEVVPQCHERITLEPFMQPGELPDLAGSCGAFVLPSWAEHWGVAVQEFAAAGLPLVVASEVPSAELYAIPGLNSFPFSAFNADSLVTALQQLFSTSDANLANMAHQSHLLSQSNSPKMWAYKLEHVIRP